MMLNESDMCWCLDSEYCGRFDCLRNLCYKSNEERVFTCGMLMGTECCPMSEVEIRGMVGGENE